MAAGVPQFVFIGVRNAAKNTKTLPKRWIARRATTKNKKSYAILIA